MQLSERFHYVFTEISDPRTKDWPLVNSTYQIPLLIASYLFMVLYLIPQFMRNRSPYKLTTFIKFYNVFQIVTNAWIVKEHINAGWLKNIPLTCVPITFSNEFPHYKFPQIIWWLLLLKIIDFTETVVFALRKKDKQISALHLYHHVSTVVMFWIGIKYVSGEMATFITLLNCSVHVMMYTYYLLAAFGPRIQAIIVPFKPYITIIQMVQFCIILIYSLQALVPACNISRVYFVILYVNVIINWYMFYQILSKILRSKIEAVKREDNKTNYYNFAYNYFNL